MVRIMRADVSNDGIPGFQFVLIRPFHHFFPLGQHAIELVHSGIPAFAVKTVKCFLIIAVERCGLLSFEFCQLLRVPES
jgi:hypothetical protein